MTGPEAAGRNDSAAPRPRLPTLRSRLVLLALVLVVPAFAAAALALYTTYRRDRSEVEKALGETTRALSIAVDRNFGQAEALLWALATSPQLESGDYVAFDARARAAMRHLPEAWVVVEEPGRLVDNTRLPAGAPLPALTDQSHWAGLKPDEFRISNLFRGIVLQGAAVAIDTLVTTANGGRVYASLLMPAGAVGRVLSEQRLPERWLGAVIDRNGVVVARSREPERFVGQPATADNLKRIREEVAQGTFESVSLDGVPTVLAFRRSSESGWTTVVGVPRADLTGPARLSALYLAGAGALLLGLGLAAASAVGRAITRPFEALVADAQALARGEGPGPDRPVGQFRETAAVRDALAVSAAGLRQREAELRRLNESLEERVAARTQELAAANAKLMAEMEDRRAAERQLARAQRLEAVGQLTGGIAHDFNNLLTAVLGSLEMLGRRAGATLDERSRRFLDNATSAAERGARLTTQLLAFSRRQRLEPKATDVNQSVEGVTGLLRSTLGGTVRMETRLAPDLPPALADATQLELIVLNLALNARDAMPDGGVLTVGTASVATGEPAVPEDPPAGEHVAIAVSDTGTGIPPEVLARVFEPFFTTKEVGKGSGLGLSQVLGIAKQLGGGVRIRSRPGEGTRVEVFLPRAAAAAGLAARGADQAFAGGPAALAGRHVLLVDDDADVRRAVASMLRDVGAEVRETSSGPEAVEAVEAAPRGAKPDLVLLDYAMPGMTGAEAARRLRGLAPGLPVVMMTGYADLQSLPARGEVDAIMGKPFKIDDLVRCLAGVLATARPSPPNADAPLRRSS